MTPPANHADSRYAMSSNTRPQLAHNTKVGRVHNDVGVQVAAIGAGQEGAVRDAAHLLLARLESRNLAKTSTCTSKLHCTDADARELHAKAPNRVQP